MKVFLNTAGGLHKPFSEDRVLVGKEIFLDDCAERTLESGIIAVADGVGGNRGGAVAAQQVCAMLSGCPALSRQEFARINEELIAKGNANENWKDMATTLTGLRIESRHADIFHVGNTRLYLIQGGSYLRQLTQDDTVVNYLFRTGSISEEEITTHPKRNEITACFGGGSSSLLNVKLSSMDLGQNSQFLMTCDGIHDVLTVDELECIVAEDSGDWTLVVERLVSEAKAKGSEDDCTAVIIDCAREDEEHGTSISEKH